MTKPSYDELEQALIVADTTIAALREQLAAMTAERDEAVRVARDLAECGVVNQRDIDWATSALNLCRKEGEAMTWTTVAPTELGWYWQRRPGELIFMGEQPPTIHRVTTTQEYATEQEQIRRMKRSTWQVVLEWLQAKKGQP